MTRLTLPRLRAMENALSAMLAGADHEGDWCPSVSRDDMEAAEAWVGEQIARRKRAAKTKARPPAD